MQTYQVGETALCNCTVVNSAGSFVSPTTTMEFKLYDPSFGVVVNTIAMTQDSEGRYHYYYNIPSTLAKGTYKWYAVANDNGITSIGVDSFIVER